MGSEYELDEKTAHGAYEQMKGFLTKNPIGTKFDFLPKYEREGRQVKMELFGLTIGGASYCIDADKICHIHVRDETYGGEVFFDLDKRTLTISAPDFRYPAEYLLAQKFVKIAETKDWCITPMGESSPRFCSKRRW